MGRRSASAAERATVHGDSYAADPTTGAIGNYPIGRARFQGVGRDSQALEQGASHTSKASWRRRTKFLRGYANLLAAAVDRLHGAEEMRIAQRALADSEGDDMLRRTLGEQARFEIALGAGLWPALTDFNQLENAILNLALNARDAMPEGGRLKIETANTELNASSSASDEDISPGPYVVVCVSDTGQGMSPEILAKVFDPFFTTKPQGQGAGLGLSMIYGFAKQSGAYVRIASTVGKGTTVKLYLPRALAKENIVGAVRQPQTPRGQGETVLVVEDDPTVRLLIIEVLNELGYVHHEAADSREALPFL
jgi:signal transduction histidine kinase